MIHVCPKFLFNIPKRPCLHSARQSTVERGIGTVEHLVDNPGQPLDRSWTVLDCWTPSWTVLDTGSGAINLLPSPFVPATPQHRLKEGKWTDWRHFTLLLPLHTAGKHSYLWAIAFTKVQPSESSFKNRMAWMCSCTASCTAAVLWWILPRFSIISNIKSMLIHLPYSSKETVLSNTKGGFSDKSKVQYEIVHSILLWEKL